MGKNFLSVFEPPCSDFHKPLKGIAPLKSRPELSTCLGWLVIILISFQPPSLAAQADPRIAASADFARSLQEQLGARLKAAINEGGAVNAIEVCQVEAPRIAAEFSASGTPSRVGRTALKVRNPDNAPDARALAVLQKFSQALADGEPAPLSNFETYPDGSARYMQSIVTQAVCLVCHGTSLSQEVQAALAERYPNDQATGFSEGALRGAFVVDWPASGQ
jgi:hypothetical protein